jgi:hypothetical protein
MHGAGFTVHEKGHLPLGVASRYAGLKARLLPCNCQKLCSAPDFCKAGVLPLTRRIGTLRRAEALFRHCERSEAIHKSLLMNRISSAFDLAMTVKRAFDIPSQCNEY